MNTLIKVSKLYIIISSNLALVMSVLSTFMRASQQSTIVVMKEELK